MPGMTPSDGGDLLKHVLDMSRVSGCEAGGRRDGDRLLKTAVDTFFLC